MIWYSCMWFVFCCTLYITLLWVRRWFRCVYTSFPNVVYIFLCTYLVILDIDINCVLRLMITQPWLQRRCYESGLACSMLWLLCSWILWVQNVSKTSVMLLHRWNSYHFQVQSLDMHRSVRKYDQCLEFNTFVSTIQNMHIHFTTLIWNMDEKYC